MTTTLVLRAGLPGAVLLAALLWATAAVAQDLGHRLPGELGLDAGKQNEAGLFIGSSSAYYQATKAIDRNGEALPDTGVDLKVLAAALGLTWTAQLGSTFYTASASVPFANAQLYNASPPLRVNEQGIADVRLMPLKLGWRFSRAHLITSYALYAPTGSFNPEGTGDVSRGGLTHEFALGGAVFLDARQRVSISALASYELNQRKLNIDITRGDTLQVQGGVGFRPIDVLNVGVAGYALWQVRDNRGTDVPQRLLQARDRVFGLGPEVGGVIPALRAKIAMRYEFDFGARSRPLGQILVFSLGFNAFPSKAEGRPAPQR